MTTAATRVFETFDAFDDYGYQLYSELVRQFKADPLPGFTIDRETMTDSLFFTHDSMPVTIYASPLFHDRVDGKIPTDFTVINMCPADEHGNGQMYDIQAVDIEPNWPMLHLIKNATKYLDAIKQQLLAMYNLYVIVAPKVKVVDMTDDDEIILYAEDGRFLTLIEAGLENDDFDTIPACQREYYLEEGSTAAY